MKRMNWVLLAGLIMSFFTLPKSVAAQSYYYQFGSYPWSVPLPVPGGYTDAANGNLHLSIPIASIAERGHVPFVAGLVYDSHIWQKVTSNGSTSWQPTNVSSQGGWRLITSAGTGSAVTYQMVFTYCTYRQGTLELPQYYTIYSLFTWTAPDGHTVPFGGSTISTSGNHCESDSPTFSGIAQDASGYHINVTNHTSAVVFAPDGTQIFPNVKDANGNYYSAPNGNGDVTDTLGRTPITTTVNGSTITYAVLTSQRTTSNFVVTTESIPVNTSFGQSGVTEFTGNITVIKSIALPDGTSYQFGYDQGATGTHYGTLTSMTLPTNGTVNYSYTNFKDAYNNQNLYLTSCSAGTGTWSYSPTVTSSCGTTCSQLVTVTKPSSDQLSLVFTMLNGQMWNTNANFYNGSVSLANLLETVTTDYNASNPPVIQPIRVTTMMPLSGSSSLSKKAEISWDTSNLGNVVNQNQWNFHTTFPTTQDRKVAYTYLSNSNQNMVNKKTTISVYQGSNTTASSSVTINYDGVATTSITGVVNHDDTNFGTSYTPRGNLTSFVNNGSTTSLVFDMTGQVTKVTDQKGNATQFGYADNFFDDSASGPVPHSVSTPTNAFATQTTLPQPFNTWGITRGYYWGTSKTAKTTDQNNATTTYDYMDCVTTDCLDRLSKVVFPIGWRVLSYPAGSETEIDSYLGIQDTTPSTSCSSCRHDQASFDVFGRPSTEVLVSDPEGSDTVTVSYDSTTRVQSMTDMERSVSNPTDGSNSYLYDGLGRVTKVTHSDGSYISAYYGAGVTTAVGGITAQLCAASTYGLGYPVLVVDEAGKKRETWTDGFGRAIEVDEPDNSGNLTLSTCYSYDVLNNLTGVAQGSQMRSYTYDSLSRLTVATTPESGTVRYYYTTSGGALCSGNSGAICRFTDARSITTTYTYDRLNRVTGITYSDTTPAVTYTYDGGTNQKGFRTSMTDGSGSATWTYDAVGWVTAEQRTIGTITKTISYSWNQDGSLASLTYPSGNTVTYNIGNAERPTWAKDLTNGIQYAGAASYAPIGAVNSVLYGQVSGGFNGITESRAYNSRLEFNTISASSSVGTAQSLTYNYNLPSGNDGSVNSITNGISSGLSESFSYDSLSRILTAATTSNSATGCWGDSFGPAGPPPPGPPDDRWSNLTQINITQCTGGSLSATVSSATNQLALTGVTGPYDLAGNMVKDGIYIYTFDADNHILTATGMSGGPWNYVYDGNGLRVEKSNSAGGTLYWRLISGEAIAETDLTGSTSNSAYKEYVFFGGRRIASRDGSGNVKYYYADHLGSVMTITDGSGNPCYQATFTPYGEEHATLTTCSSNYKFTGYERDPETSLDYAYFRYYNSRLGRFMSADPIGGDVSNPQTLNRYAYVTNKPTNMIDPLGLYCAVGRPCPQQSFDPSFLPDFMATALLTDWNLGFGIWPEGSPQSPLPGALLVELIISAQMFGGGGQAQAKNPPTQNQTPKEPTLLQELVCLASAPLIISNWINGNGGTSSIGVATSSTAGTQTASSSVTLNTDSSGNINVTATASTTVGDNGNNGIGLQQTAGPTWGASDAPSVNDLPGPSQTAGASIGPVGGEVSQSSSGVTSVSGALNVWNPGFGKVFPKMVSNTKAITPTLNCVSVAIGAFFKHTTPK